MEICRDFYLDKLIKRKNDGMIDSADDLWNKEMPEEKILWHFFVEFLNAF